MKKLKSIKIKDIPGLVVGLVVVVFLGCAILYVPWKIIENSIDWDPRIAIDNYSSVPVKIYVDNEFLVEVPSSKDFGTNSLGNKLFTLDEGDHHIKILSIDNTKKQEYKIRVSNNNYYVINVFNSIKYDVGIVWFKRKNHSRKSWENPTKSQTTVRFIKVSKPNLGYPLMFEGPPKNSSTAGGIAYITRHSYVNN